MLGGLKCVFRGLRLTPKWPLIPILISSLASSLTWCSTRNSERCYLLYLGARAICPDLMVYKLCTVSVMLSVLLQALIYSSIEPFTNPIQSWAPIVAIKRGNATETSGHHALLLPRSCSEWQLPALQCT